MAESKKGGASNQERLAEKGRQAETAKQPPGGNDIAQKANGNRQQKGMHKQSGKK